MKDDAAIKRIKEKLIPRVSMKTVHLDVTAADTRASFREGVGPTGVSPQQEAPGGSRSGCDFKQLT